LRSSEGGWFGKGVDMSFDDELRRVFERKEPPPGFADRVLARINQAHSAEEPRRPVRISSAFAVRWIAAAAAGAVLTIASSQYYASRQAAIEEAKVKEQLRVSLQIASEKLNDVERKVREHSQRDF
jgi:glycerol-3-phosphate O-acyltransferase